MIYSTLTDTVSIPTITFTLVLLIGILIVVGYKTSNFTNSVWSYICDFGCTLICAISFVFVLSNLDANPVQTKEPSQLHATATIKSVSSNNVTLNVDEITFDKVPKNSLMTEYHTSTDKFTTTNWNDSQDIPNTLASQNFSNLTKGNVLKQLDAGDKVAYHITNRTLTIDHVYRQDHGTPQGMSEVKINQ